MKENTIKKLLSLDRRNRVGFWLNSTLSVWMTDKHGHTFFCSISKLYYWALLTSGNRMMVRNFYLITPLLQSVEACWPHLVAVSPHLTIRDTTLTVASAAGLSPFLLERKSHSLSSRLTSKNRTSVCLITWRWERRFASLALLWSCLLIWLPNERRNHFAQFGFDQSIVPRLPLNR